MPSPNYLLYYELSSFYEFFYMYSQMDEIISFYSFSEEQYIKLINTYRKTLYLLKSISPPTIKSSAGNIYDINTLEEEGYLRRKIAYTLNTIEELSRKDKVLLNKKEIKENMIIDAKKQKKMLKSIINEKSINWKDTTELINKNYKRYMGNP